MLVQETIQPLLRYFSPGVVQTTNTSVVSIANAQAVRIVAHVGLVTGSVTLRVFVNNINDIANAVPVPGKSTSLATNSSYEIFVSGSEVYAALARASFMFVRIEVGDSSSAPLSIEISAFPGRDIPSPLPPNWTRIL